MKYFLFIIIIIASITAYAMPAMDGIPPKNYNEYKSKGIDQPSDMKIRVSGQWNAIVILIDFPDYRWDKKDDPYFPNDSLYYDTSHYNSMFNSIGTYAHPGSQSPYTGSMRDFYLENSYGTFDLVSTTTVWYTAPDTFNYYCNSDGTAGTGDDYGWGSYPNNVQKLVEDALAAADSNVDFSLYDNDNDGYVDALFVVHAGPGAEAISYPARTDYIWSHKWSISTQTRDGVHINEYSMENQDGKVGVYCHEFGHVLGLPDLYDTDYSSSGVGDWCVMSGGSWGRKLSGDPGGSSPVHFSAPFKWSLEWLNLTEVDTNMFNVQIPPVENNAVGYLINTPLNNEYFIIENRQNVSYDTSLVTRQVNLGYERASGLVIWHVDDNISSNSNEAHRLCDVEEASPYISGADTIEQLDIAMDYSTYQYLYNGNRGDNGDPWPGYSSYTADNRNFLNRDKDSFNSFSCPNSNNYNGNMTQAGVENISQTDTMITADLFSGFTVHINYPLAGDTLPPNDSVSISWFTEAATGISTDSLWYSIGSGSTWHFICTGDSTFEWHTPGTISDSYRLRIKSLSNNGFSETFTGDYFVIDSTDLAGIQADANAGMGNMKSVYLSPGQLNADITRHGFTLISITGSIIKTAQSPGKYWVKTDRGTVKGIILLK